MRLEVQILPKKQIEVCCKLAVHSSEYCFAMLDSLHVCSFFNNGRRIDPILVEACRLHFRPPMKKYAFSGLQPGELTFCYTGELKGFFLFMQDALCHFSFYNAWYPMGFDADESYEVVIRQDQSKTLLNGVYEQASSSWRYCAENQAFSDCNILLYDPQHCTCIENDAVCMLFFDKQFQSMASTIADSYTAVVQFYSKLYARSPGARHTIVFLPQGKNCPGAYIRENMIVLGETYQDARRILHLLAHELGHTYAAGADTESWEDWLNETHAEWSALLYTLETAPELFEILISELRACEDGNGFSLRPNGDDRPQNVHTCGTRLYYDIYQQYGCDAIKMLLRTYAQLKTKKTACFLKAVLEKSAEIAAIIGTACK